MPRTTTLTLGELDLTLTLNFRTMADVKRVTGVNLMDNESSKRLMDPDVLPEAIAILATTKGGPKVSPATVGEAIDMTNLPAVTEALAELFKADPS